MTGIGYCPYSWQTGALCGGSSDTQAAVSTTIVQAHDAVEGACGRYDKVPTLCSSAHHNFICHTVDTYILQRIFVHAGMHRELSSCPVTAQQVLEWPVNPHGRGPVKTSLQQILWTRRSV